MFGGFSKWIAGERADGADSRALPVVPETHWPEMRVLVLVANDQKKGTRDFVGCESEYYSLL